MSFLQENPENWTVDALCKLASKPLEQVARSIIRKLAKQRLLLGRCLLALDRNEVAWRLGYSGAVHYAMRQGVDERTAREARRVAGRLEELPLLRDAAEKGEVVWASLREIVRKATEATEARWLELASEWSSKVIQRLVRQTAEGEEPGAPEAVSNQPEEVHLHFRLDPETAELYQRAVRELSLEAGRPLSAVEVLASLCLDRLGSTKAQRDRAAAEARKDGMARREAEARAARPARATDAPAWSEEAEQPARTVQEDSSDRPARTASEEPSDPTGSQRPAQVIEELPTPFAALAARAEMCPSDVTVKLVRSEKPDWSNPRLRFSAEARLPTPAQRREVMRRDAYCCANPGCPNKLWLAVHHVVFYCVGGVTLPGNLVAVCTRCHSNIHKGRLRVTGAAPDGLVWTDRWGNRL